MQLAARIPGGGGGGAPAAASDNAQLDEPSEDREAASGFCAAAPQRRLPKYDRLLLEIVVDCLLVDGSFLSGLMMPN